MRAQCEQATVAHCSTTAAADTSRRSASESSSEGGLNRTSIRPSAVDTRARARDQPGSASRALARASPPAASASARPRPRCRQERSRNPPPATARRRAQGRAAAAACRAARCSPGRPRGGPTLERRLPLSAPARARTRAQPSLHRFSRPSDDTADTLTGVRHRRRRSGTILPRALLPAKALHREAAPMVAGSAPRGPPGLAPTVSALAAALAAPAASQSVWPAITICHDTSAARISGSTATASTDAWPLSDGCGAIAGDAHARRITGQARVRYRLVTGARILCPAGAWPERCGPREGPTTERPPSAYS